MAGDDARIAELNAVIQAVRERVRMNHPQPGDADGQRPIQARVADLMPVVHARDAAQARVAAIGSVNPRAGGIINALIQFWKRLVARLLGWFVRDQVVFNRETVASTEAVLEVLNEHNLAMIALASQTNAEVAALHQKLAAVRGEFIPVRDEIAVVRSKFVGVHDEVGAVRNQVGAVRDQVGAVRDQVGAVRNEIAATRGEIDQARGEARSDGALLRSEAAELKDIRKHWVEWRAGWEHRLATNEIQFLRSVADLQGAFQHRSTLMDSNFREIVKAQHADYLGALDRANIGIQQRLWADLEKIRETYERLIHNELRFIRQHAMTRKIFEPAETPHADAAFAPGFDYARFAERFRGDEEYVRRNQDFYQPFFAGQENVLDIGCGRGEMLETLRDAGVAARGIDSSEEAVLQCRAKGLNAESADLFEYLAKQPDDEFGGIVSSQVVEHLSPELLPEMIRLCAAKMRRGGVLAIETPNPECLAIFATHFYLDPTHTRPVPNQLLAFYMEEAGFGRIEVHRLSPAEESIPEIRELPEEFRKRFFGGLDYAIIARKL